VEQQARVIRSERDYAWVRVGGQSGCAACDAGKGCGAGIFGRLLQRRPVEVKVPNPLRVQPGQGVLLTIPDIVYLQLVLWLLGVPLAAGLVGALAGFQLVQPLGLASWASDLASLLAGLVMAVLVLRYSARRMSNALGESPLRLMEENRNSDLNYEVNCESH
jgi:sigma-E factor negative regulatory protein RseC